MSAPGSASAGGPGTETTDRSPSPRVDVCVVGAGPAGGLVAHRLAAAGHDVVVLEAGPRFDPADRLARQERSLRPGYGPGAVWGGDPERDAFASTGERYYPLDRARVRGVGGTTLHWQGMVMRLKESDFERASRSGYGRDWPIAYEDLRPYYARAEDALGVAGADDNPFGPPREQPHPMPAFPPSHSDGLFAEACAALDVPTHSVGNARNSEPTEAAGACVGYGTCRPVCPSGAKYDATRHIDRAVEAGARVIDRAHVRRLEHDDAGERVTAARYTVPDGTTHRQAARHVVVAAGGVETPRLLLLSRSETYPDGLANSSGAVGRYFHDHLFAGVGGRVAARTRQHHVGFHTTESHRFYDEPGAGTPGGVPAAEGPFTPFKLEFFNHAGPSPVERSMTAGPWGDELLEELREAYGNSLAVGGLVAQPPQAGNRVRLHPTRTDDAGDPVPDVVWSLDDRTRRTIRRANEVQRTILSALDAELTWTVGPDSTGPGYHHMGTTRMGTDPTESVVDPSLRTHDLRNCWLVGSAAFVTGGAMNPTLTIAALALRAADRLDEVL